MDFGGSFNIEWLADWAALRQCAVALDGAGFDYLTSSGHLLTTRAGRYPELPLAVYSVPYRDHFVMFSYLAGLTERIVFRPAILILPLFPTALVAKQAADLSLVSGNRFQLGLGISWQEAEYRALGQPMRDRGRKLEEQIEVLRLLWSQPLVTFQGRFHDLDDIGIGQLPEQPIKIWLGSGPEPQLLRRAAELADGWTPAAGISDPEHVSQLLGFADAAGRRDGFGVTGRVAADADASRVVAAARRQIEAGATEITIAAPAGAAVTDGVAAMITARRHIQDAIA